MLSNARANAQNARIVLQLELGWPDKIRNRNMYLYRKNLYTRRTIDFILRPSQFVAEIRNWASLKRYFCIQRIETKKAGKILSA